MPNISPGGYLGGLLPPLVRRGGGCYAARFGRDRKLAFACDGAQDGEFGPRICSRLAGRGSRGRCLRLCLVAGSRNGRRWVKMGCRSDSRVTLNHHSHLCPPQVLTLALLFHKLHFPGIWTRLLLSLASATDDVVNPPGSSVQAPAATERNGADWQAESDWSAHSSAGRWIWQVRRAACAGRAQEGQRTRGATKLT